MKFCRLIMVFDTTACQFGSMEMVQAELKKKGLKMFVMDDPAAP